MGGVGVSVGWGARFPFTLHPLHPFHGYSLWLRLCQIKIACEAETLSCRGRWGGSARSTTPPRASRYLTVSRFDGTLNLFHGIL